MAISRTHKQEIVAKFGEVLNSHGIVLVARNKGLTVKAVNQLRRNVRAAGGAYAVVKNRLAKIALTSSSYSELGKFLIGPTAVAYADDPVALAKALVEFAKIDSKLELCGGVMNGRPLDENAIKMLAALPSMDELRGKIVGVINAPASKIVGVLQAPGAQLARVLNAYATK